MEKSAGNQERTVAQTDATRSLNFLTAKTQRTPKVLLYFILKLSWRTWRLGG